MREVCKGGDTDEVDPLRSVDHLDVLHRDVCSLVESEEDRPHSRVIFGTINVPLSFAIALICTQGNSQGVVPSLTRAIKRSSAVKDDVRAAEEPERCLVLEGKRKRAVLPVVQVVAKLDRALQVLSNFVSKHLL